MNTEYSVFLGSTISTKEVVMSINQVSGLTCSPAINGVGESVHELKCFGIIITLDSQHGYGTDRDMDFENYKHEVSFDALASSTTGYRALAAKNLALLFAKLVLERHKVTCMVVENLETLLCKF